MPSAGGSPPGAGPAGPSWPSPHPTVMARDGFGMGPCLRELGRGSGCGCCVLGDLVAQPEGPNPALGAPGSEQTPPGESKFEQPKPPCQLAGGTAASSPRSPSCLLLLLFFNLIFIFCTLCFQAQVYPPAPRCQRVGALGKTPGVAKFFLCSAHVGPNFAQSFLPPNPGDRSPKTSANWEPLPWGDWNQ